MAYGEFDVERQGWARWPKTLIMCRKRGCEIIERRRYVQERTCRIEGSYYDDLFEETCTDLSCGHSVWQMESPLYCPECGARVIGTEAGV